MAILKNIYPAFLAVLLTGCYEEFTPDVDSTPVLCLNSLITAGEPVEVDVSRTWFFTDADAESDHSVPDARVAVYVNGVPAAAGYIAAEGDNIRIVAESAAYGRAEAEVTVPPAVPAESLTWEARATDRWTTELPGWDMVYTLSFDLDAELKLADPAGTDNYYHFNYSDYGDTDDDTRMRFWSGTFRYEAEPIFSEHIGQLDAVTGSDADGFTLFTDRQFAGKSYTLHLQFHNAVYDVKNQDFDDELLDCGLVFTLSSVSQSYYNLCCYRWQIENGLMGDLGDVGLGEPVWGYSNVSTGAGVVAAQTHTAYTIDLKNFLKEQMK